jgi:ABC-type hemin transport system substrate-binding protein
MEAEMLAYPTIQDAPEVSPVERSVTELIKRIRKLRWIGLEDEAEQLQVQLQSALRRVDQPRETLLAGPVDTD